jgi:hypothetical protein
VGDQPDQWSLQFFLGAVDFETAASPRARIAYAVALPQPAGKRRRSPRIRL